MLLICRYKEYWFELEEKRKQKVEEQKKKHQDVLTAPDPFHLTQAAREHARAVEKAKREMERRIKSGNRELPSVRMSEELRAIVERAADAVGGSASGGGRGGRGSGTTMAARDGDRGDGDVDDDDGDRDGGENAREGSHVNLDLVPSIVRMGFRKEHVEEALR